MLSTMRGRGGGWAALGTAAGIIGLVASNASASIAPVSVTSGFNLAGPSTTVPVDYDSVNGHWHLQADLVFDHAAGPMGKVFRSPTQVTGAPILLDAFQPFPQPLWEEFFLVQGFPGGPPSSRPVSDWHEEILTPGWEWVLPGDARFPNLFPPGESLITRDGQPWQWQHQPHPGGPDPTKLWVEFPPIDPGHVLDVHKALLWVGTPDNRVWGDGTRNDGTVIDESSIRVREYPTPEPATLGLVALGAVALLRRR